MAKKPTKKDAKPGGIAILGSHPATVEMAPFDSDWTIYACSPHNYEHRKLPRFDAWFEIHIPLADNTRPFPYLKYLETLPLGYMRDQEAMPFYKGGRPYPEKEAKERFGPYVFTSSIAFMMAMAIMDIEAGRAEPHMGLFGIMQASPNEYTYQRPGIQQLAWEAHKIGVEMIAPDISKLFDPPPENF